MSEKYANAFATTLSGAALVGDDHVHANAAAPAALQGGPFRIAIDAELLLVTAGASTTTWTVVRGVEGTTAAGHLVGAAVTHVLTRVSLLSSSGAFDVRAYGAVGDGVTDDTVAIQAAIDAAGGTPPAARGGTVYFPPGVYTITATLTIPDFVRLTGPNRPLETVEGGWSGDRTAGYFGAQIIVPTPSGFDMIRNADGGGNTGIEIDHLRLDQRGATGDYDIMAFTNLWRSSIHDISFRGATATTYFNAISITGEENRIHDNRFDGCGLRGMCHALAFERNDIGASGFIDLSDSWGPRIVDNHLYNAVGVGLYGLSLTGATISGNLIEDCGYHGMAFNRLHSSVISGNVLKQNSQASAGYSGIVIDSEAAGGADSSYNIVANNQCFDDTSPTQSYGIKLVSYLASATNGNVVIGNSVHGNVDGGIYQQAGLSNFIHGNAGYNPVGLLGPPAVPATTVAYTNAYGVDAEVNVNGGTVTVVAIGGQPTGRTSGGFRVPAGQTITLTYSVAPTWTWFGD